MERTSHTCFSTEEKDVKIKEIHAKMVKTLMGVFSQELEKDWNLLKVSLQPYLKPVNLHGRGVKDFADICRNLIDSGGISYGSYNNLINAVEDFNVPAAEIIRQASSEIKALQFEEQTPPARSGHGEDKNHGNATDTAGTRVHGDLIPPPPYVASESSAEALEIKQPHVAPSKDEFKSAQVRKDPV